MNRSFFNVPVPVGAYQGRLWFRYDSQQGEASLTDSGSPAWSLTESDVDGLTVRRGSSRLRLFPGELADLLLPRLPVSELNCSRE